MDRKTNGQTRGRGRAVAVVAALAIVLGACGEKGSTPPAQGPRGGATLPVIMSGLPEETVFVVAVTDLDGFRAALANTALGAAWNDERLQTWRQQSWPKWKALLSQTGLTTAEEIDGLLHGDYVFFIRAATKDDPSGGGEGAALLARSPGNRQQVEAFLKKVDANRSMVMKTAGEILIHATDEGTASDVEAAVAAGRSPLQGKSKSFTAFESNYDKDAFLHVWVNIEGLIDMFLNDQDEPAREPTRKMLGAFGVDNVSMVYYSLAVEKEGFRAKARLQCDSVRHGLLGMFGEGETSKAIRLVPENTKTFVSIRHAGVEKALSIARGVYSATQPQEVTDENWQGVLVPLGMFVGIDIQTELPKMIGKELAFSSGGDSPVAMEFTVYLETADGPNLLGLAERLMAQGQIEAVEGDHKGVKYKYVNIPVSMPMVVPIQIAYGQIGDFVVVSTQQLGLKKAIDAYQAKRSLADNPKYRDAMAGAGEEGWFESYSQLPPGLAETMVSAGPLVAQAINNMFGANFTAADVPDIQVFLDHMKPSVARGRADSNAVEIQSFSTGAGAVALAATGGTAGAMMTGVSTGLTGAPTGLGGGGPLPTNLSDAQIEARVSRTRIDMRSMATAIETFFVENRRYPGFATGASSYNGALGPEVPAALLPGLDRSLLQPTPYVAGGRYMTDPFCPKGKATFVYWSVQAGQPDPSGKTAAMGSLPGWILASPGPDGDYDIADEWDVYDPKTAPSKRLLTGKNKKGSAFTYDPTNGLKSDGDIWRIKR